MSNAKEIRTKIASIKKTQKTTRAMEMVSASKIRKAQSQMSRARPYAEKIRQVIHHLSQSHPEYRHRFLDVRPQKRAGLIIISSDRGLCGGLNTNLFKMVVRLLKQWQEQAIEFDFCLIGTKAEAFFKRAGGNIVAHAHHLGDTPNVAQLIGVIKVMLDAYSEGKIDALYVCHNEFINRMSQKPLVHRLLPIVESDIKDDSKKHHWDYIYEPDAKKIIDLLLRRYMESQVYRAAVENMACEHAARMVAMKNATENAGELIKELQLDYNKARQAAITKELSEIVAGAEAV
jgi:F-type H+-transporting ATPase subunit gamma